MQLLSRSQTLQPRLQGRACPVGKGDVTSHFQRSVNHSALGQVSPHSPHPYLRLHDDAVPRIWPVATQKNVTRTTGMYVIKPDLLTQVPR